MNTRNILLAALSGATFVALSLTAAPAEAWFERQHFAAGGIEHIGAMAALFRQSQLVAGDQIDRDVLFENPDVGMAANLVRKGGLNGQSGRISDMDHAPGTVSAFLRQVVAGCIAGKGNALVNQPVNGPAAVLDHEACRPWVIEQRACADRVTDVRLDRVAIVEHGRYSPLRPARRTVFQRALADQRHLAGLRQPQRGRLSSKAAANDENVGASCHAGDPAGKGLQL